MKRSHKEPLMNLEIPDEDTLMNLKKLRNSSYVKQFQGRELCILTVNRTLGVNNNHVDVYGQYAFRKTCADLGLSFFRVRNDDTRPSNELIRPQQLTDILEAMLDEKRIQLALNQFFQTGKGTNQYVFKPLEHYKFLANFKSGFAGASFAKDPASLTIAAYLWEWIIRPFDIITYNSSIISPAIDINRYSFTWEEYINDWRLREWLANIDEILKSSTEIKYNVMPKTSLIEMTAFVYQYIRIIKENQGIEDPAENLREFMRLRKLAYASETVYSHFAQLNKRDKSEFQALCNIINFTFDEDEIYDAIKDIPEIVHADTTYLRNCIHKLHEYMFDTTDMASVIATPELISNTLKYWTAKAENLPSGEKRIKYFLNVGEPLHTNEALRVLPVHHEVYGKDIYRISTKRTEKLEEFMAKVDQDGWYAHIKSVYHHLMKKQYEHIPQMLEYLSMMEDSSPLELSLLVIAMSKEIYMTRNSIVSYKIPVDIKSVAFKLLSTSLHNFVLEVAGGKLETFIPLIVLKLSAISPVGGDKPSYPIKYETIYPLVKNNPRSLYFLRGLSEDRSPFFKDIGKAFTLDKDGHFPHDHLFLDEDGMYRGIGYFRDYNGIEYPITIPPVISRFGKYSFLMDNGRVLKCVSILEAWRDSRKQYMVDKISKLLENIKGMVSKTEYDNTFNAITEPILHRIQLETEDQDRLAFLRDYISTVIGSVDIPNNKYRYQNVLVAALNVINMHFIIAKVPFAEFLHGIFQQMHESKIVSSSYLSETAVRLLDGEEI